MSKEPLFHGPVHHYIKHDGKGTILQAGKSFEETLKTRLAAKENIIICDEYCDPSEYKVVNGKVVKKTAADKKKWKAEKDNEQKEREAAAPYDARRAAYYPQLGDLADAIYWERRGDGSKMEAWLAACDKVKKDVPK